MGKVADRTGKIIHLLESSSRFNLSKIKCGFIVYPFNEPKLKRTIHINHKNSSSTAGLNELFRYARGNWKSYINETILDKFLDLCNRDIKEWN